MSKIYNDSLILVPMVTRQELKQSEMELKSGISGNNSSLINQSTVINHLIRQSKKFLDSPPNILVLPNKKTPETVKPYSIWKMYTVTDKWSISFSFQAREILISSDDNKNIKVVDGNDEIKFTLPTSCIELTCIFDTSLIIKANDSLVAKIEISLVEPFAANITATNTVYGTNFAKLII